MICRIRRFFTIDINLGKASSLLPGTMKAVEYQGDKYAITVYNQAGKFFATGGKCPHYGAPLALGKLVDNKVYCPWHAAAFDIQTGNKLTFPPVRDLPSYPTSVNKDGDLIVHLPDGIVSPSAYVDHNLAKYDQNNKERVVIIGGGAAGLACADTLRKSDYSGEIVMVSQEDSVPYDRINLSKNFKVEAHQIWLRPEEYFASNGIQFLRNTQVSEILPASKNVKFSNGQEIKYDKLLIASGSSARILPAFQNVKGLENVCSIRNLQDHTKIKKVLAGAKNVVIVGGSFLGLESANSIASNFPGVKVTVVELETVPLKRIVGENIGKLLQRTLEAKGVRFLLGKSTSDIETSGNTVTSVTVEGRKINLDLLLLSTGAQINTSFVPADLLNQDGSVRVSAFLQSDDPHIFAAGDVANYLNVYNGQRNRIEHWSVAQEMGAIAAKNILGKATPFSAVPFFWSNQAVNLQFVGFHGELGHTETVKAGTDGEGHLSYFFNGNKTVGVAIGNWPGAATKLKSLYEAHRMPTKAELLAGKKFSDL